MKLVQSFNPWMFSERGFSMAFWVVALVGLALGQRILYHDAQAATPPPRVLQVEPSGGPPGTVVVIRGDGFNSADRSPEVDFNGMTATVVRWSAAEIFSVVPSGLTAGTVSIRVRAGSVASEPSGFVVSSTLPASLSAARQGDRVVLAWPARAGLFALESAPSLDPPVTWTVETNALLPTGELTTTTATVSGGARFFRLRTGGSITRSGSASVAASAGGNVAVAGGTASLSVPPGALAQDTRIDIIELAHSPHPEVPFARDIALSPAGLGFQRPATLDLRLPEDVADPRSVEVYSMSAANELSRSGVELSRMRRVTNVVFESASRTLRVPVEHFSVFSVLARRLQEEIVFDIPGKYLKKGDLIYTLTSDAVLGSRGWIPGHCGMYLGTTSAFSDVNDGATIIESTSADTSIEKKFGGYVDGVQIRTDFGPSSGAFKILSGLHLYMGARRPHPEPTDDERQRVAAWALSRVGTPYASLGGTFLFSGESGLSCVGLTERAYESIGRNIVPGWMETPLMPARQFSFTDQVTEVTIQVGDTYVMDSYGVIAQTAGEYTKAHSRDFDLRMSVDASSPAGKVAREGRARFTSDQGDFQTFTFKPAAEDADLAYLFRFTLEARSSGNHLRTRPFLIYVREKPPTTFVRVDPPIMNVQITRGSASLTNFILSAKEAILPVGSTNAVRLFWEPPPASIPEKGMFTMRIESDNGTAPNQTRTSTTRSPYLLGQIEDFTNELQDTDAFAGYRFLMRSGSDNIYQLLARPLEKSFTPVTFLDPESGRRGASVRLFFTAFRYIGAFNPVEFQATVTWRYREAP